MTSPKQNDQKPEEDKPKTSAKTAAEKLHPHDEQNQATIEEFDEEGMGVAPKE